MGVASGLSYLHGLNPAVAHGDLRGVRLRYIFYTVCSDMEARRTYLLTRMANPDSATLVSQRLLIRKQALPRAPLLGGRAQ